MQPRLLVIAPNWIGDAIMAQPLLQILRSQHPHKAIDVLAPSWVAPVIRAMAEVDTVIESSIRHGSFKIREYWRHVQTIRDRDYAEVYVLPNTIKYALLPWLAGIQTRIGYRGESRYGLINVMHHDSKAKPRAMTKFYAALATPPDLTEPSQLLRPLLGVSSLELEKAYREFGISSDRLVIALATGAEFGTAKKWPSSHFSDLVRKILHFNPEAQIILLGSAKDIAIGEEIRERFPCVLNLAGRTSLDQAIALISGVDAIVSNDSGLLHIASALNRPTLALYGPTDPHHAPSHAERSTSISLNLSCSPCKQRECPLGHQECMKKIDSDMVWQPLRSILVESSLNL